MPNPPDERLPAEPPADALDDIESRQDAVLEQLAALNERLERVLAEFGVKVPENWLGDRPADAASPRAAA